MFWTNAISSRNIAGEMLDPKKKSEYLNLPNYLTFGRVLLIPLVLLFIGLINPGKGDAVNLKYGIIAALIFILAGVSDVVDGYYARKYKINSVFGKYFDPLADKLMVLAVMIMVIPLGRLPAWMVIVFLTREISITALRGIAGSENIELPADYWGKKKTATQTIGLIGILVYYPLLGFNVYQTGYLLIWLSLIITIGSGVNYVLQFIRAILKQYPK